MSISSPCFADDRAIQLYAASGTAAKQALEAKAKKEEFIKKKKEAEKANDMENAGAYEYLAEQEALQELAANKAAIENMANAKALQTPAETKQLTKFESGLKQLDPNATQLEKWQGASQAIIKDVEAVNNGRAAAGPDFPTNDLAGIKRVADEPGKWEFNSDGKYKDANWRTDNPNYVSDRTLPGLEANKAAWSSLEAQPKGGSQGYQDFQGGVTREGTLRSDGTVRVGDVPHFSNGVAQDGGFNILADGKLLRSNLGTDSKVFQATGLGRTTSSDGEIINLGTYTSGGKTYEQMSNGTYVPAFPSDIVSQTQLMAPLKTNQISDMSASRMNWNQLEKAHSALPSGPPLVESWTERDTEIYHEFLRRQYSPQSTLEKQMAAEVRDQLTENFPFKRIGYR